MKKFLSVLLAVAMIISVVSVVSFAADEFKQVIKYDFEDEKAPDGYQGKNANVGKNHRTVQEAMKKPTKSANSAAGRV